MRFEKCFKCGKIKLAVIEAKDQPTEQKTEMVMMGWGKRNGQFKCKNCKEKSKF